MSKFTNRFRITHEGDLVRVMLMDQIDNNTQLLVENVMMRRADALDLAEKIIAADEAKKRQKAAAN